MDLQAQLLDRERQWMEAVGRGDGAALAEILSPEYTMTSSTGDGTPMNREQCIAWVTEAVAIKSFSFSEVHLTELDDVAVLKMRLTHEAELDGQDWSHTFLITDVWVRKSGHWRVLTRHSSLPGNARQSV